MPAYGYDQADVRAILDDRNPDTYLSVSTSERDGKRYWRLIHKGMPMCPDSLEPGRAVAAFRFFFRYSVPPETVDLWDGDLAGWRDAALKDLV